MNGKQARLSPEVMKKLKDVGQPFETVDDCLKRVLGCSCIKEEMTEKQDNEDKEDVSS